MKNIVVCCDGTNNQLEGDLTNVVRLFEITAKNERQAAFYDPGVGTMADPLAQGWLGRRWSLVKGLAFGAGLEDNVFEAYRYLMRVYEPGDRIFLFGFSRGAFTVRVLAGMLYAVGLLYDRTDNLLPYLWRTYRGIRKPPEDATSQEKAAAARHDEDVAVLRRSFTRECPVHFLGLWDTVGSVGLYNWNQSFPYTYENPGIAIVRHAVSLDERRAAFRSNVLKADPTPLPALGNRSRVMNVWFAGVHSDIGGGYAWPADSGLAMISFEWMVREARAAGLEVDDAKLGGLLTRCPPNPLAQTHVSLRRGWWVIEYLPARRNDWGRKKTRWRYEPNKQRMMREAPFLHQSVLTRMQALRHYRPPSLPPDHGFPTEV